MKLNLYRQSGQPVNLEDRENYDREFKITYDKCAERAGLDMLKLNRMISFCERQLVKKWNKTVLIEVPKSKKGFKKLLAKYEDVPIMIAITANRENVIAVLMDQLN
jgi:hypothetical protein